MLHTSNCTSLGDLPDDLLQRIAGFLEVSDALAWNSTCQGFHEKIPLSQWQPRVPVLVGQRPIMGHYQDRPTKAGILPIPKVCRIHSILLRGTWKDQGWGNQKGRIWIVAKSSDRVVARSSLAPHERGPLKLSFVPETHETYELWYEVGGGGGHVLHFTTPVFLHVILWDEPTRWLSRVCTILSSGEQCPTKTNSPPIVSEFLEAMARSLLYDIQHDGKEPNPIVADCLTRHGIPVDQSCLERLTDLCQQWEPSMSGWTTITVPDPHSTWEWGPRRL